MASRVLSCPLFVLLAIAASGQATSRTPSIAQRSQQHPESSPNHVAIMNGEIDEEQMRGETVVERMNAAIDLCGSAYLHTCVIRIAASASAGFGWKIPPNNVTVEDLRNLNGFGYPDGELTGMRGNIHYIYHAGANDLSETSCQFCGKNVLLVDAIADGGAVTTGSNASLQAIVGSVFRRSGTRQIWGGNFVANFRNLGAMVSGIEVDTSNEADQDDAGLESAGVRIVNNGRHSGIGLRINSVVGGNGRDGLPSVRGYMIGVDDEDYHVYGMKMNSRDPSRAADLYIVAGSDSPTTASIVLRDAADRATVAAVQNDGSASFHKLAISSGIANSSGLEHVRGDVGCTTAATVGALCKSPGLSLPVPFPDTQYTIACSLEERVGQPTVIDVIKRASAFNIEIAATSNSAATARFDCIAMHD